MKRIARVAVLGAGTMGAGIAATIAEAGVPVVLLDLEDKAQRAVARLVTMRSSPLTTLSAAERIEVGSLDQLERIADADWIVEAIVEDLALKRELYARVDRVRKRGAAVTSNTSTIPITELLTGAPAGLAPDFAVTHFFNPPHTMRLLEIAGGHATRPELIEELSRFGETVLGKSVVRCSDTPGFIANRLGCYWLSCAIAATVAHGVALEDADAVLSRPFGIPKTGAFGLVDLIGVPLFARITDSLGSLLDPSDAWHEIAHQNTLFERMTDQGLHGRAAARGFYRMTRDDGRKVLSALDLRTLEYHEVEPVSEDRTLSELLRGSDANAQLARDVAVQTLAYATSLVPSVNESASQVDLAMKLGFGWSRGPFELIDELGPAWVTR